jgi:hypothetical protein
LQITEVPIITSKTMVTNIIKFCKRDSELIRIVTVDICIMKSKIILVTAVTNTADCLFSNHA